MPTPRRGTTDDHRIELVKDRVGSGASVSSAHVVRRGSRSAGGVLIAACAICAALLAWAATGSSDEGEVETGGFVLPDPADVGYELRAAFQDTDEASPASGDGPVVEAFGPVDGHDPWASAFVLYRSRSTTGPRLSGEVVVVDGIELLVDATGPGLAVRWERAGETFTARSARLERAELLEVAAAMVRAGDGTAPGYETLHRGRAGDFATRRVLSPGGLPGTTGIIYRRTGAPRSTVLLTWAPGDEARLRAPTVASPSLARTTIDGRHTVAMGPDGLGRLITVSWLYDGFLVEAAAGAGFPGGVDGLIDVVSAVEPVDVDEFTSILAAHRGSLQLDFQASVREDVTGTGTELGALTADIDGARATTSLHRRRAGSYLLRLRTDLGARSGWTSLDELDITTVVRVDLPARASPGLWVLAGIAPSGLVDVTATETTGGAPVATVGRLAVTDVPGTDRVLFIRAVTGVAPATLLDVVLHDDGGRTEFRL